MQIFAQCVGMVGVILIMIAYLWLELDKWSSHSRPYTFLNLMGSLLILFSLYFAWNLPAVIMETLWALISIYGIFKSKSGK